MILRGDLDILSARQRVTELGLDPGGSMVCVSSADAVVDEHIMTAMRENTNRLITPDDARRLFEAKSVREILIELDTSIN